MAGPWERYQATPQDAPSQPAQAQSERDAPGPWAKYQPGIPKADSPDLTAPKGEKVYNEPIGPEQASALDRFKERVQDPERWRAIIKGEGPYAANVNGVRVVQGDVPLVLPGGAIPKLTGAALKLAEGKGLAYALGRTALSTGQGAAMSAIGGKEGESWEDKLDRVKSGAKLSGGIQLAAESIPVVGKALGYAGRKIGQAISGVDESLIANYAKKTNEVNALINKSGGDMPAAADAIRAELQDGIRATRSELGKQISDSIAGAPKKPSIPIRPIIDELEKQKARLDPIFHKEAIGQIDGFINQVKQGAVPESSKMGAGLSNAKYLNLIKEYLQGKASSSYMQGGQIFQQSPQAAQAAKAAAAVTRRIFNQAAPEAAKANNQLSLLHGIEKNLNKNLIAPGKSDAALFAAGSGTNARNAKMLERLGDVAKIDALGKAKDLATAKVFANPSLTPTDWTGKAASRVLLAGGVGTAIAGPVGGAIGAGLASPMALKAGINAMSIGKDIAAKVPSFAKLTRENPVTAQSIVQVVSGQIRRENAPPEAQDFLREHPKLMQDAAPKGERRWAERGIEKLGIQDAKLAQSLMNSKEGKRLLIDASGLRPGSRGMKRIIERIDALKKGSSNESRSNTEASIPGLKRNPARGR